MIPGNRKNNTGIFPVNLNYTTDLHSMGQWIQDGLRVVFETFVVLNKTNHTIKVPFSEVNIDNFNYLCPKSFEDINNMAYKGTQLAHWEGGVPVSTLFVHDRSEEALGQLFYFFEKAIAISGYLSRVNPFDQPGVEAYKKNMFALLSKPGFEEEKKRINDKLETLNG